MNSCDRCTKKVPFERITGRSIDWTVCPLVCEVWIKRKEKEKMSKMKWIPVTERLPIKGTNVLIYSKRGGRAEGELCEDGWWQYRWCCKVEDVTHWMPIPEPPENGVTDTNVGAKSSWAFASLDEIIDCYSEPPERSDAE